MICLQNIHSQTDEKSILKKQFEKEKKILRQLWDQQTIAFEQEFNRSKEKANPLQEKELKRNENNSALISLETNMDSNYVIVEAIAVGRDRAEAINLVETVVMKNLLEKSKQITQVADSSQISILKTFLKNNHIPLIKKLTPLSSNQIQARYKIKQPLLGSNGLLQFLPDTSSSSQKSQTEKTTYKQSNQDKYTGLIIDARRLNIKPNLIIYVQHEDHVLYRPTIADRTEAIKNGLAKWHTNIEDARTDQRAGSNPFIVIPTDGEKNRIYYIGNKEEQILAMNSFQKNILKNCRVIIVK